MQHCNIDQENVADRKKFARSKKNKFSFHNLIIFPSTLNQRNSVLTNSTL